MLLTWPVGEICSNGSGPAQPDRTVIKALPDGTQIIEQLGRCLRVRVKQCYTKCLPPETRIATPLGDVPISALRIGDAIWTRDATGKRIAGRIDRVSRVPVEGPHHVARIVLDDGRTLRVSPQHPAADGRLVEQLRRGDSYEGARVTALDFVEYTQPFTHDVLPSGPTGVYWANGIPLGSTLR